MPLDFPLTRRTLLRAGGMSAALLALSRLRVAPAIALSEAPASTALRVLGPRDARILSAIAERMTFTGDPNMPRFGDTAGVRGVDTALLPLPPRSSHAPPF